MDVAEVNSRIEMADFRIADFLTLDEACRAMVCSSPDCNDDDDDVDNVILKKREPLEYCRARSAVQKDKEIAFRLGRYN